MWRLAPPCAATGTTPAGANTVACTEGRTLSNLGERVTLVAGATFVVSGTDGDIHAGTFDGVYHRDVRVISGLAVTVDGSVPPLLATHRDGPAALHQVHQLAADDYGNPTALLLRHRHVERTIRESFEVHVFGGPAPDAELRVALACDFARLVPLRHEVVDGTAEQPWSVLDGRGLHAEDAGFAVTVDAEAPDGGPDPAVGPEVAFRVSAEPGRPWRGQLVIRPKAPGDQPAEPDDQPAEPDDQPAEPDDRPTEPDDQPAAASPDRRGGRQRSSLQVTGGDMRWRAGVASAVGDLEALRVEVPALGLDYIGAGAPWYMALFGRDAVIAAWEGLLAGPAMGLEVLASLARFQGTRVDEATGEQPGRILHELRTGGSEVFGVPSGTPYFGTVDATPLFVMLLAEVHRWGADGDAVRDLLPAARAAVGWCSDYGDLDRDGYVEYVADPTGLQNLGWKDSADSMVHSDGTRAATPLALVEAQAYVWAAYQGLATLEERMGDPDRAVGLRDRAAALRAAFERDFWIPDRGLVAMGLDAGKRPLAVAASNMGHCLWTGILGSEIGDAVAARLSAADLAATWGLRTLAASERAYNPLGYHLGTIWPHDTAIGVAGLLRYGHVAAGVRLADGLLDAAEAFGWRLPELFGGFDADEVPYPVPYPVACSPQAWSAAVPLMLLRTLLRLDPDVPAGVVRVAPVLPEAVDLTVTGIPLGAGTLDLRVRGSRAEVLAAPAGLTVETG